VRLDGQALVRQAHLSKRTCGREPIVARVYQGGHVDLHVECALGARPVARAVVRAGSDKVLADRLARSAGIGHAKNVATSDALASALASAFTADGPHVLVLSTAPDIEVVRPPIALDPVVTKHRFMTAIGAPHYIPTLFGGGGLERD
jgi:hypothetical protein